MIGAVGYKVITLNRNQKELFPTMNTFSKKSLHVALAGLSTLGLAGAAEAVIINPNGLGQVLIYPYYTVRNGFNVGEVSAAPFNTLLSIVNTTASTKSVKVRFREGKASQEVLDFNVFLSPYDVWVAAVEPDGASGAMISTPDNSCTIPKFPSDGSGVPFRTFNYDPGSGDPIGGGRARLTEGYFEVFEMATYDDASGVAIGAKHNAKGVPSCAGIDDTTASKQAQAPSGGLSGEATLINVLTGDAFTEDATALVQFISTPNYVSTGSPSPDYSDAAPAIGAAVTTSGNISMSLFPNGSLATTAALQKSAVINEFTLEKSTLSGTDWVLTFPTKHNLVTTSTATPPFQRPFTKVGSCDDINYMLKNREEGPAAPPPPGTDFSPTPPGTDPLIPTLCWEANIITFNDSNVLGSANKLNIKTDETNGWVKVGFRAGATNLGSGPTTVFDTLTASTSTGSSTFSGLPTIGFMVQTFVNGTLTSADGKLLQSSYGGNFGHRYEGPQP